MRRDLVHALAEAREACVQQFLVDHALEAEVAAQRRRARPARRCRAARPPPRSRQSSAIDIPARLPALVVGQDLALDPGPRGLAEELVLVARPGRARTRRTDGGHARIMAPAASSGGCQTRASGVWPNRWGLTQGCGSDPRVRFGLRPLGMRNARLGMADARDGARTPWTSSRQKGHGHWDGTQGSGPTPGVRPNCSGQTPFVRPGGTTVVVFGP